jgi:hypothetical protein
MSTVRPGTTGRKPLSTQSRCKRTSGRPTEAPDAQEQSTGPDEHPASIYPGHLIRGPSLAFSIREFCLAHRISVPFYFQLKAQGLGPREMKLGTRRIISAEAATEWRARHTNRTDTDST